MSLILDIGFSNIGVNGVVISIIGYLIVFIVLVVLFYVFSAIPKLLNFYIRQKLKREGKAVNDDMELQISGEVNAAISMALYLYLNELHDSESNIITIKKVSKAYSPWSSKIYGLQNFNAK